MIVESNNKNINEKIAIKILMETFFKNNPPFNNYYIRFNICDLTKCYMYFNIYNIYSYYLHLALNFKQLSNNYL